MLVDFFRQMGGYPVGEDTAPQYDWQRSKIASNAFSSIFDTIGGIGNQLTSAWAARDYADKAAAAQQRAYENAAKIAAAQKESLMMFADFNATEMRKNASRMMTAATNLRTSAEVERNINLNNTLMLGNEAKYQYASSGVVVNTGSAKDVTKAIIEISDRNTNQSYKERINQITSALDQSAQQKLNADMTQWAAKERGRFLDAQTDLRLY
jgi:hypothetical protein